MHPTLCCRLQKSARQMACRPPENWRTATILILLEPCILENL
ncbi:hypothetical protein HM1_2694 [Heliomicrobium modesticaldum Ice1]|uniref:Uncharacterized protein n=1 Tax=Heliobacterium modesticaldum (strain ATCC 51547 / Ice1) TaxID=498761 RepID=B0TBV0_HELMI|nr:hypothetical protein HM1_2694 [Heliomicrobium modesticaldum Ice1]